MATWTCPDCDRTFGAVGRSHVCEPGLTLDEWLGEALPVAKPVVERVLDHLRPVDSGGDLIVDPIPSVILLKNGPVFCTIRNMTKWVAVGFYLRRRLESPRLSRKVQSHGGRHFHVVNVDDEAEIDDELLGWVGEAFTGPDPESPGADPMVPDDVDEVFGPPD